MNKKLKISKYLLIVSGLTLITIIFFVVYSGYNNLHGFVSQQVKPYPPIDTDLDLSILDSLSNSIYYPDYSADLPTGPDQNIPTTTQ